MILKPILDYFTDFLETFRVIYPVNLKTHLILPLRSFLSSVQGGSRWDTKMQIFHVQNRNIFIKLTSSVVP